MVIALSYFLYIESRYRNLMSIGLTRKEKASQISTYIRKKKTANDQVTVTVNRYGRVYEIPFQLEAHP
jgi:hypothetical protein